MVPLSHHTLPPSLSSVSNILKLDVGLRGLAKVT